MSVTVRRTGEKPSLEAMVEVHAKRVAAEMPRIIRERVARGLDIFDRPFAAYDRDYAAVVGSRVDLSDGKPGGLLATLQVRVVRAGAAVSVVVAPDAAHARVAGFLQAGTPKMKARPWLGLSPRDLVVLNQRTAQR